MTLYFSLYRGGPQHTVTTVIPITSLLLTQCGLKIKGEQYNKLLLSSYPNQDAPTCRRCFPQGLEKSADDLDTEAHKRP